ncbi:MAG: hypothetical protein C0424_08050 [Sphingobacteriaceae bacterium]|nr:hypothetical protein [Sphingobacteriaceae bacterium]
MGVCWLVSSTMAQDRRELLRKQLNAAKGSEAIELTIKLAKAYNEVSTDSAIGLMQDLVGSRENQLTPTQKADAYSVLSNALRMQGRLAEALNEARKAQDLYDLLKDSAGISAVLSNMGTIYYDRSNFQQALDYYLRALKYKEAMGQLNGIASLRCNIGNIYINQKQYEQARIHYEQAQEMFVKVGNRMGIGYTYNNLGVIFDETGELEKAINAYMEAFAIDKELGDKFGMASSYLNLGEIYIKTNQLALANEHLNKSLQLAREIANPTSIGQALNGLARVAKLNGNYKETINLAQNALEIARAASNRGVQRSALQLLIDAHEKTGSLQLSLNYTRELMMVKDSIEAETRKLVLNENQSRYETERKEQEIALLQKDASLKASLLNRQSLLNKVYIGAIGVSLLFLLLLFNRFNITKRNREELRELNSSLEDKVDLRTKELQTALVQAEKAGQLKTFFLSNINHELRKPLNAIIGMGEYLHENVAEPEIRQVAENLLDSGKRLSKTMTDILELSDYETTGRVLPLEKVDPQEIITKLLYELEPTFMAKGLHFEIVNFAGDQEIRTNSRYVYRILQSLLENAIKFTEKGSVKIEMLRELWAGEPAYCFRIVDTGVGISEENLREIFEAFRTGNMEVNRGYEGLGIGLTLARKYAEMLQGQISADSREGKGSVFTLRLPLRG